MSFKITKADNYINIAINHYLLRSLLPQSTAAVALTIIYKVE
jgi:hypothetical protein